MRAITEEKKKKKPWRMRRAAAVVWERRERERGRETFIVSDVEERERAQREAER